MDNWFATWFDSTYYHLLYRHRNDEEARFFMDKLVRHLKIAEGCRILDLACGKGRHSIYLADKGYDVTGVDLSPESIEHAKQYERKNLHFHTHDMRETLNSGPFDYIFNLFTSFGYFPTEQEHISTLLEMKKGLTSSESILVIDFFNAHKSISGLVLSEEKTLDGISFRINRRVENGYILKDIRFEDKGQKFYFQERVRAFVLEDFDKMFAEVGLQVSELFGSYDLREYNKQESDRLIMLVRAI